MKTTVQIRLQLDSVETEIENLSNRIEHDNCLNDIFFSTMVAGEILTTTYKERLDYLLGQKTALKYVLGIKN